MESFPLSPASSSELVEMANEELQILQTQHPDRFGYLKLELESFIFQLLREHQTPPPMSATSSSSVALTQVSSTNKSNDKSTKKKKNKESCGSHTSSSQWINSNSSKKSQSMVSKREGRERVDIVLERAQLCLQKIKEVKSSLF